MWRLQGLSYHHSWELLVRGGPDPAPEKYLRWPLDAMLASGFGAPFLIASCCSTALASKYSSHAAASWVRQWYTGRVAGCEQIRSAAINDGV